MASNGTATIAARYPVACSLFLRISSSIAQINGKYSQQNGFVSFGYVHMFMCFSSSFVLFRWDAKTNIAELAFAWKRSIFDSISNALPRNKELLTEISRIIKNIINIFIILLNEYEALEIGAISATTTTTILANHRRTNLEYGSTQLTNEASFAS